MDVEANMRIPGLSLKSPGAEPQVINNSGNRFTRMITVDAVPKVGDALAVPVSPDLSAGGQSVRKSHEIARSAEIASVGSRVANNKTQDLTPWSCSRLPQPKTSVTQARPLL